MLIPTVTAMDDGVLSNSRVAQDVQNKYILGKLSGLTLVFAKWLEIQEVQRKNHLRVEARGENQFQMITFEFVIVLLL